MTHIRLPLGAEFDSLAELAADAIGPERAGPFIRSHFERHHLLVADEAGAAVGLLAYRTDWFQCTFVSLVCVHGLTANHTCWLSLAGELSPAYRPVAYDLRGRGDSAVIPGTNHYTILLGQNPALRRALHAFLDGSDDRT